MNEWIMDMARGEFGYKAKDLTLPLTPYVIKPKAGKVARGSFTLKNAKGLPMKGMLRCMDERLRFGQDHFMGTECEIAYEYSAEHLAVGEVVKGKVWVVSDRGEYELPYAAHVEAPTYG